MTPAPAATATPAEAGVGLDLDRGAGVDDWAAVLGELDTARTRALERGSLDELAQVVDRNGTAWVADAALARRVSTARATLRGGSLVVTDVRVASLAATSVVLVVRDRRTAYTVTVDGSTQQVPERQARWWQLRLVRDGDRWLFQAVDALSATDATGGSAALSMRRAP
jgi:Tfp pilus assembly PilM family ATPase